MWIWADNTYRFTDFFNITSKWRHNDFILEIWFKIWGQSIKFSMYAEFQLKMLSIGWNIKHSPRYCNVTQKERLVFQPSA